MEDITAISIPRPHLDQLKTMESLFPFLDLPAELRNYVYHWAADWNDALHVPIGTPRTTPTVLLINRQIHLEATAIIYKKPLVLREAFYKTLSKRRCTVSRTTYAKISRLILHLAGMDDCKTLRRWIVVLQNYSLALQLCESKAPFELQYSSRLYVTEGAKIVSQRPVRNKTRTKMLISSSWNA